MDSLRMNTLLEHINRMDSALADKLDRYKTFTEKERPQVLVVCSEKLIFSEMSQLFTGIDDIDVNVYGAYDDADVLYDVMLSDVVIAATSALRIAPVGLCNVLSEFEKVSKEIYVLLSGWGSITRSTEQAEAKKRKVTESFLGSYIRSIKSIYKNPCDGFMLPCDAMNEFLTAIRNDAERLRTNQEEHLYSMLKAAVYSFYDKQQALYDNQVSSVINAKRLVQAKSGEYSVRLSHLTVNVQYIIDKLMSRVLQIEVADIEYANDNDLTAGSLSTIYEQNQKVAEQEAKKRAVYLITKTFNNIKDEQADTVADSGKTLEAECKNDMLAMVNRLKSNEDIPKELMGQIELAAADTTSLKDAVYNCSKMADKIIDSVSEKIASTINSFHFSLKPGMGDRVVKISKRIIEELSNTFDSDETPYSLDNSYNSDAEEDYEQKQYECFLQDIENMLADAYAKLLNLLQERTSEIKSEIEEKSKTQLIGYFTNLDKLLSDMAANLDKQKSSYSQE